MANVGSGNVGATLIGNGNGASPTYKPIGTNSGLTAHGLVVAEGNGQFVATGTGSVGQVLQSSGNTADPAYSTAAYPVSSGTSGYVITSNGTDFIVAPSSSTSIMWSSISASQTLAVANGYFCVSPGGILVLALPTVSNEGDTIEVVLEDATGFVITQNSVQQIYLGNQSTTLGTGGSVTSSIPGDSLRMVCRVPNEIWRVVSSMGNPLLT